jgi:hypothetical protein
MGENKITSRPWYSLEGFRLVMPEWFRSENEDKSIEGHTPEPDTILFDLDALEDGIKNGWKEQEVQRYLKAKPYLFRGKCRSGHGTWAFPEQNFGGKYYADWLIASGSSGGISWELIELECPQSTPFKKNGHLSDAARKGVEQIQDWRNWIQNNLHCAQNSKSQDGLGLFDLTPQSFGLIVVGRNNIYQTRDGFLAYNKNRKDVTDQNRIRIESYESFIESLRFRFTRPPYQNSQI